eukprot:Pgem_evm1s15834
MSDYFGQKGIPWHGAAILYKQDDSYNVIYIDQICRNSGKEDEARVGLLFGSIMEVIKSSKVLQKRKNISVLRANASYYSSRSVFRILYYICKKNEMNLVRYFHNESCDGKTFLDGHFGVVMQLLIAYICTGFDILTPEQLAIAISLVTQSFVLSILIQFDSDDVQKLTRFSKDLSSIKGIKRVRDITFENDNDIAILNYFSNTDYQPLARLSLEGDIRKLDGLFPDGFSNVISVCVKGSCGVATIEEINEEGIFVAKNLMSWPDSNDEFEETNEADNFVDLRDAESSLEYAKIYTKMHLDTLSILKKSNSEQEFQETDLSDDVKSMIEKYFPG